MFSRHEWVGFHELLAVIAVILVIVHIVLHWSWVMATTKRIFGLGDKD
ncbi:hypothetical protein [Moorella naiadis (nom. illeg.)]